MRERARQGDKACERERPGREIKPVRERARQGHKACERERARQGDKACERERGRQGDKACERERQGNKVPGREIKPVREREAGIGT